MRKKSFASRIDVASNMQDIGKEKAKAYAKLRKKDYTGAFECLLSAMLQELRLGRDIGRTLEELYKPAYLLYKLGDSSYQIQTWRQLVKPHLPVFLTALENSNGNLTLHLWNELCTIATENNLECILFGKANCLFKLEKYNLAWDCYSKLISMKSNGELIKLLKLIGDLESWPTVYLRQWCELVLKHGNEELLDYLQNQLKSLNQEPSMINNDLSNDDYDSSHAILKGNINEHSKKLSEELELLKVSKSTLNSEIQSLKSKEVQKNSECMKISSKEAQLSYETDSFRVMSIEQEIERIKMRVRNLDKQIEEQSRKINQREYTIEKHKSRAEEYEKKKENLCERLEELEKNEVEPVIEEPVTVNSKFEILLETWEKLFDQLQTDLLRKANFLWDLKQYEKSWFHYIEFYIKSYSYKTLIIMFSLAFKLEKRGNPNAIETWRNLALEFVENDDQSSEFLFSLKRDMCMKGKIGLFKELDDRMHSARIARNPTGEVTDWKYLRQGSRISTDSTCSAAETSTEYLRLQLQAQNEK